MRYALACILFAFLFLPGSYAQTIGGSVLDATSNQPIPAAYIKIYRKDSVPVLTESALISKGRFEITLRYKYRSIIIEVTSNGYQPETRTITLSDTVRHYSFNFFLSRIEYKEMKPVEVSAGPAPVVIKNDTTTYNPRAFRDGTERKLEDLLKKLPGIQVNEKTGEVKFKGKAIEKMLIEGDDLFGRNYTLGTRNIGVDMIAAVQAIENFSDNYVLKGIEHDEKVALNLQLVKTKMKINGGADLGAGIFANGKIFQDHNVNAIGINSLHKFFSNLSYNNAGTNRSPIDYFGNNYNSEQNRDLSLFNSRFINDLNFSDLVDEGRASFNNQFFGSYNGLFKLGKKTSLKFNLMGISDRLRNQQYAVSRYFADTDTIINIDSTLLEKKPYNIRADVYLRNNTSSRSLFEFSSTIRHEDVSSWRDDYTNYLPYFLSNATTRNLFFKNEITYSKRIAAKSAFQLIVLHAFDKPTQRFFITPPVISLPNIASNTQVVRQQKNTADITGNIIGAYRFGNYTVGVKALYMRNDFGADLKSDSLGKEVFVYPNNADYTKLLLQQKSSISFRRAPWNINASLAVNYLSQELENRLRPSTLQKRSLYIEPAVTTSLRLSYYSKLSLTLSASQKPNVENFIFENELLQGIRSVAANIPSLNLDRSRQATLAYGYNNLYNQFDLNAGLTYQQRKGGYLPFYEISQTLIVARYRYYNINFSNADAFVSGTKYIPGILSTIKLALNLSRFNYKNFVNEDTMRNNVSYTGGLNLLYKTMFRRGINFQNSVITNTSIATSSGNDRKTSFTQLQNQFRIIASIRKTWLLSASWDCIIPDGDNLRRNFNFIDAAVSYKPAEKKYEFRLLFKNILDNRTFGLLDVSDYFASNFRINTLPMHCALYFTRSF